MITRLWRGWTTVDNAEAYERFLLGELFPSMREIPGFRGADMLRRLEHDEVAFITLTRFDSLAAIREVLARGRRRRARSARGRSARVVAVEEHRRVRQLVRQLLMRLLRGEPGQGQDQVLPGRADLDPALIPIRLVAAKLEAEAMTQNSLAPC
jgi:heme-degrading monooxygenase HmoA